jgi:sugar phosphate isomerase/epimerase
MKQPQIYAFADEASPIIDKQIIAMRRNGLQGLEIRNVDGESVAAISLDKAREVRAKMDAAGLKVWSIGSPSGKIDIEKDDFNAHMDTLRHVIEVAKILGAENIRMFSFYIPAGKNPADYRAEVLRRLHIMADAAEGTGVTLCHENEKGIYGDMANRCLEILEAEPRIAGVFDPANFVQCGQDTWEAWKLLGSKIKYMHIKDALFKDNSVVPAGKGDGQVDKILKAFLENGGECLTVEPHLTVFDALKTLEREGEKSRVGGAYAYPSSDAAFDAACQALRELLG